MQAICNEAAFDILELYYTPTSFIPLSDSFVSLSDHVRTWSTRTHPRLNEPLAPGHPPLPVSRGTHTLHTNLVGCLFLWKQDSTTPGY